MGVGAVPLFLPLAAGRLQVVGQSAALDAGRVALSGQAGGLALGGFLVQKCVCQFRRRGQDRRLALAQPDMGRCLVLFRLG